MHINYLMLRFETLVSIPTKMQQIRLALTANLKASAIKKAIADSEERKEDLDKVHEVWAKLMTDESEKTLQRRAKKNESLVVSELMGLSKATEELGKQAGQLNKCVLALGIANSNLTVVNYAMEYYKIVLIGHRTSIGIMGSIFQNSKFITNPPSCSVARLHAFTNTVVLFLNALQFHLLVYNFMIKYHVITSKWDFIANLKSKASYMAEAFEIRELYAEDQPDLYASLNVKLQANIALQDELAATDYVDVIAYKSHALDVVITKHHVDQLVYHYTLLQNYLKYAKFSVCAGVDLGEQNPNSDGDDGDDDGE